MAVTNIDVNLNTGEANEWLEVPVIGKPTEQPYVYANRSHSIAPLIGSDIPEGYSICGYEKIMAGTPLMRALARSQNASWSDDLEQQQVDSDLQAELLRIQSSENSTAHLCNQFAETNHLPEDIHRQYALMTREETHLLESEDSHITPDGLSFRIDPANPDKMNVRGWRKTTNWVAKEIYGVDHDLSADEWNQCKQLSFMLRVVNDSDNTESNQYWVRTIMSELDNGETTTFLKLQELGDHFLVSMSDHDPDNGYVIESGTISPHGDIDRISVNDTGYAPPATNTWGDSPNKKYDADLVHTFGDFASSLHEELAHAIKRVSKNPALIRWREKNGIKPANGALFFRTLQKLSRNKNILSDNNPFSNYGLKKQEELCWRLYDSTIHNPKVKTYVQPDMSIQYYYRNRNKFQPMEHFLNRDNLQPNEGEVSAMA